MLRWMSLEVLPHTMGTHFLKSQRKRKKRNNKKKPSLPPVSLLITPQWMSQPIRRGGGNPSLSQQVPRPRAGHQSHLDAHGMAPSRVAPSQSPGWQTCRQEGATRAPPTSCSWHPVLPSIPALPTAFLLQYIPFFKPVAAWTSLLSQMQCSGSLP